MPTPEEVFHQIAHRNGSVWLDGGDDTEGWSILSFDPIDVLLEPKDWREAGRKISSIYQDSQLPFTGGCIGYVGYGAGHVVTPMPRQPPAWEPEVWLGHYLGALCFHHRSRTWHCSGPKRFQEEAMSLLASATPLNTPPPATSSAPSRTTKKSLYLSHIQQIHDWLIEGDCYQVNLTRPVWLNSAGDPWSAYRRLRHHSTPTYGAYLKLDNTLAILSNSPELLLDYDKGVAVSDPIKGTRPRGKNETEDLLLRQALEASVKDRAELTMIVDLVRNDLGRVAKFGSVKAENRAIRTHANVHHASQRISAELIDSTDPWTTLGVLFPPGSVTGAPKIRACTRIAELETEARGVYCGAIGYASGDRAVFNVAIRTAVWNRENCRFHVGGGIVIDSDAEDEWQETIDKASVMSKAFGAEPND